MTRRGGATTRGRLGRVAAAVHAGLAEPASDAAFEIVTLLPGFTALHRRSGELDGNLPVRAARYCGPVFEGNAAGFQITLAQPMTLAHLWLSWAATLGREIESRHGVKALHAPGDLTHAADIVSIVAAARAAFGSIDILVNNAVVRHAAPVESFSPERWDDAIAVNLSAAFHLIRLTMADMKARGWGRIVNVSSIYGLKGAANRVAYVTTKTALLGLTRAVALEGVAHGVTCNAVCPGFVETDMMTPERFERWGEAMDLSGKKLMRNVIFEQTPQRRFVTPAGVASMTAYLLSDLGEDITGQSFNVSAGIGDY